MSHAIIGRWGKNLAVPVPGEIAEAVGLADGERVEINAEADMIVIRRAAPPISLQEMFAGKTADEWRREYRDAYDWGPDIGREAIE